MADELGFHLAARVDDLVASGVPRHEAERRARLESGGLECAKEACRSTRRMNWVHDIVADVRHASRLFARQPAFSLFAVLTLAVGIGAATVVFTLVNAVLLRELPFAEPERLAWMYNARTERDRAPFSIPDLEDYRRDAATIAGLAPFTNWTANLTGTGDAERLEGTRVAGNFFSLVGAKALLGRTLVVDDEATNARVAVIGYALWKRRFGGQPQIVGTAVVLNGAAYTVVGVLPSGFLFPFRYAEIAVPLPLRDDPRRADRGANFLRVVARLKPAVSFTEAKATLDTIARRLQRQFPDDDARKTGVNLYPLHAEIVSDYRQILWTLFGAVGVLLLIGCGNLANLLLLRAARRRTELTVRESLGASRGRIVRQLVTEAVVLAALGGAGGLLIARGGIAAWRMLGPANFPRMDEVALDLRVLAFAGVLALATAIVCGVIPAWSASRDLPPALGDATRTTTGGRRQGLVRRAFVVLQVGGSAVLLVTMGLVAHGFARLERVDPGFTADHAVSIQLSLPPNRYNNRDAIAAFYDALRVRLASLPGVRDVGTVSLLPLGGLLSTADLAFPDRPAPPPDEVPQAHFRIASAGYFGAAGIGIVEGRPFETGDTNRGRPVAVVNQTFANRHWPGEAAIGKYVRVVLGPSSPPLEVVGVVKNVKQFDLEATPTADLYVPIHQMPASQAAALASRMYWVVRTEGDARTLGRTVRQAVHSVDPEVATSSVRTLDDILAASLAARQTNVRLLEIFGQISVVLSAIGVYAVAAFSASGRRRELAVRSAFGATRRQLATLMFREELQPVAVGLAIGLITALLGARTIVGVVFETSPWDPGTYLAVAAALSAVGVIATYVPARRAATANPADLLRL